MGFSSWPEGPQRWEQGRNGEIFRSERYPCDGWISRCYRITYIYEILDHLGVAQAEEPKIGPLWRIIAPQEGNDPRLAEALLAFDFLIVQGVTPGQHCKLIDLLCSDLALGPPEAGLAYSASRAICVDQFSLGPVPSVIRSILYTVKRGVPLSLVPGY